jgi:hypothetical protein
LQQACAVPETLTPNDNAFFFFMIIGERQKSLFLASFKKKKLAKFHLISKSSL